MLHMYYYSKILDSKELCGMRTEGSLGKKLGELKSIWIGNVMEKSDNWQKT